MPSKALEKLNSSDKYLTKCVRFHKINWAVITAVKHKQTPLISYAVFVNAFVVYANTLEL